MARFRLPALPTVARKLVQYILAFVISVGVGTAPLWGGGKIPGYQSILDVFPQDLQDVIPWASILMSITAVGVQFANRELLGRRWIRHAFWATFLAQIVLVPASYAVYKAFVIRINVPGAVPRSRISSAPRRCRIANARRAVWKSASASGRRSA